MQTRKIAITGSEEKISEALKLTEEFGRENGLGRKENLRLRLLAEELIGLMRGVTEETSADYWIEREGNGYALHLASDVKLNRKMREEILAVSTTGANAAAKGFMGKLKDMIASVFLPDEFGATPFSGFSLGMMNLAGNASPQAQMASADVLNWSMQRYKAAVESDGTEDAEEKKYELEHSIVASVADEVTASVKGSHVEITIQKAF